MTAILRRYFPLLVALAAVIPAAIYFIWTFERGMSSARPRLTATSFDRVPGWDGDDHAAALGAYLRSCARIEASGKASPLMQACLAAKKSARDAKAARAFFETWFIPFHYPGDDGGCVTGYYEPDLAGARTRGEGFAVPVYRRPDDLVQLSPDVERAKHNDQITAGRMEGGKAVPYATRAEIEEGSLNGRGLELMWLADPIDAYFMHVQGSGRIALAEGGHVRIGYAAKNGHPYTGIGRLLIERGEISREAMSMQALKAWLRAHPGEAKALMRENKSYIFFRELPPGEGDLGPIGAQGAPLTAGRSLAVDGSLHDLGSPILVSAPDLTLHGEQGFNRLMIAQDVGSAIKGAQRGDIFWGSGDAAGEIAGRTRHKARFYILLPKAGLPAS
ncbi:MAG: MltA domain-containing protein [Pseudomonadota bacterium]|nr:MltA domain-containing protein [Pseudomonadota bacterium]